MSLKAAAAAFSVSPATAHRWWHRWLDGERGGAARRCRVCSIARAGRTARRGSSRRSSQEAICACRRETGWGPRLVAGATGFAHSTVWKVLQPGRDLAAAAAAARSRPTATSGPAPAICCTWTPAATRASCGPATASPATARSAPRLDAPRDEGRLRLRARDRRRPLPARLRRAPRRREGRDRHRLPRARARLLRRARRSPRSG